MRQHKKNFVSRLLAVALSLIMVVSMLPVVVAADEWQEDGAAPVITAFVPLADEVTWQVVPVGTELSELYLPSTLLAVVEEAYIADYAPETPQLPQIEDEDVEEDVVYYTENDNEEPYYNENEDIYFDDNEIMYDGYGVCEGYDVHEKCEAYEATPGADIAAIMTIPGLETALVSLGLDLFELMDEETQPILENNYVQVPVTWYSADFDPYTPGVYVFTAQVYDFVVETDLPTIEVTVVEILAATAFEPVNAGLPMTNFVIPVAHTTIDLDPAGDFAVVYTYPLLPDSITGIIRYSFTFTPTSPLDYVNDAANANDIIFGIVPAGTPTIGNAGFTAIQNNAPALLRFRSTAPYGSYAPENNIRFIRSNDAETADIHTTQVNWVLNESHEIVIEIDTNATPQTISHFVYRGGIRVATVPIGPLRATVPIGNRDFSAGLGAIYIRTWGGSFAANFSVPAANAFAPQQTGSGRTFRVGPTQEFTTLEALRQYVIASGSRGGNFANLNPGDTILVYPNIVGDRNMPHVVPANGRLFINANGTEAEPITLRGVIDANGNRPIIASAWRPNDVGTYALNLHSVLTIGSSPWMDTYAHTGNWIRVENLIVDGGVFEMFDYFNNVADANNRFVRAFGQPIGGPAFSEPVTLENFPVLIHTPFENTFFARSDIFGTRVYGNAAVATAFAGTPYQFMMRLGHGGVGGGGGNPAGHSMFSNRAVLIEGGDNVLIYNTLAMGGGTGIASSDGGPGTLIVDRVEVAYSGMHAAGHNIYFNGDQMRHPHMTVTVRNSFIHNSIGTQGLRTRVGRNIIYNNVFLNSAAKQVDLVGHDAGAPTYGIAHGVYPAARRFLGYTMAEGIPHWQSVFDLPRDTEFIGNVSIMTGPFHNNHVHIGGAGQLWEESWGRYRFVNNTFIHLTDQANTGMPREAIGARFGVESVEMFNNVFFGRHGNFQPFIEEHGSYGSLTWAFGERQLTGDNNWMHHNALLNIVRGQPGSPPITNYLGTTHFGTVGEMPFVSLGGHERVTGPVNPADFDFRLSNEGTAYDAGLGTSVAHTATFMTQAEHATRLANGQLPIHYDWQFENDVIISIASGGWPSPDPITSNTTTTAPWRGLGFGDPFHDGFWTWQPPVATNTSTPPMELTGTVDGWVWTNDARTDSAAPMLGAYLSGDPIDDDNDNDDDEPQRELLEFPIYRPNHSWQVVSFVYENYPIMPTDGIISYTFEFSVSHPGPADGGDTSPGGGNIQFFIVPVGYTATPTGANLRGPNPAPATPANAAGVWLHTRRLSPNYGGTWDFRANHGYGNGNQGTQLATLTPSVPNDIVMYEVTVEIRVSDAHYRTTIRDAETGAIIGQSAWIHRDVENQDWSGGIGAVHILLNDNETTALFMLPADELPEDNGNDNDNDNDYCVETFFIDKDNQYANILYSDAIMPNADGIIEYSFVFDPVRMNDTTGPEWIAANPLEVFILPVGYTGRVDESGSADLTGANNLRANAPIRLEFRHYPPWASIHATHGTSNNNGHNLGDWLLTNTYDVLVRINVQTDQFQIMLTPVGSANPSHTTPWLDLRTTGGTGGAAWNVSPQNRDFTGGIGGVHIRLMGVDAARGLIAAYFTMPGTECEETPEPPVVPDCYELVHLVSNSNYAATAFQYQYDQPITADDNLITYTFIFAPTAEAESPAPSPYGTTQMLQLFLHESGLPALPSNPEDVYDWAWPRPLPPHVQIRFDSNYNGGNTIAGIPTGSLGSWEVGNEYEITVTINTATGAVTASVNGGATVSLGTTTLTQIGEVRVYAYRNNGPDIAAWFAVPGNDCNEEPTPPFALEIGPDRYFRDLRDFQTRHGFNNLQPGDTVLIFPNTNNEPYLTPTVNWGVNIEANGLPGQPITIRGVVCEYTCARPIILAPARTTSSVLSIAGNYIVVENVVVDGGLYDFLDFLNGNAPAGSSAAARFGVNTTNEAFPGSTLTYENFISYIDRAIANSFFHVGTTHWTIPTRNSPRDLMRFHRNQFASRGIAHRRGNNVEVRNVFVTASGTGLHGFDFGPGNILVCSSEFGFNGTGDGGHNLYFNGCNLLFPNLEVIVQNSFIHNAIYSQGLRTRVGRTILLNNFFLNNAAKQIDLVGYDAGYPGDNFNFLQSSFANAGRPAHWESVTAFRQDNEMIGNVSIYTELFPRDHVGLGGAGKLWENTYGRYRFVNNTFIALAYGWPDGHPQLVFQGRFGMESVELYNNIFYASNPHRMAVFFDHLNPARALSILEMGGYNDDGTPFLCPTEFDPTNFRQTQNMFNRWSFGERQVAGANNWFSHGMINNQMPMTIAPPHGAPGNNHYFVWNAIPSELTGTIIGEPGEIPFVNLPHNPAETPVDVSAFDLNLRDDSTANIQGSPVGSVAEFMTQEEFNRRYDEGLLPIIWDWRFDENGNQIAQGFGDWTDPEVWSSHYTFARWRDLTFTNPTSVNPNNAISPPGISLTPDCNWFMTPRTDHDAPTLGAFANPTSVLPPTIELDYTDAVLTYAIGDTLDVTGLFIVVTYSNGITRRVSVTADMVTGFDSTTANPALTLTVTYGEFTSTFTVAVSPRNETSAPPADDTPTDDGAAGGGGVPARPTQVRPPVVSDAEETTLPNVYTVTAASFDDGFIGFAFTSAFLDGLPQNYEYVRVEYGRFGVTLTVEQVAAWVLEIETDVTVLLQTDETNETFAAVVAAVTEADPLNEAFLAEFARINIVVCEETLEALELEGYEPQVTVYIGDLDLTAEQLDRLVGMWICEYTGEYVEIAGILSEDGRYFIFPHVGNGLYGIILAAAPALEPTCNSLVFTAGSLFYTLNGTTRIAHVAPFIDPAYDRMMVPAYHVANAIGVEVAWDGDTRTVFVFLPNGTLELVIDQPIPGGSGVPVIVDDRAFIPLRYVMEIFGASVAWIPETRSGDINWCN